MALWEYEDLMFIKNRILDYARRNDLTVDEVLEMIKRKLTNEEVKKE